MKKVLFVASECVPFIKTGGLADVIGSLPKCFDKMRKVYDDSKMKYDERFYDVIIYYLEYYIDRGDCLRAGSPCSLSAFCARCYTACDTSPRLWPAPGGLLKSY